MFSALFATSFRRGIVIPSVLWLLICFIYIFMFVGWGTLLEFLPNEIAVTLLGILAPILVLIVLYIASGAAATGDGEKEEFNQLGEKIARLSSLVEDAATRNAEDEKTVSDELAVGVKTLRESITIQVGELSQTLELAHDALNKKLASSAADEARATTELLMVIKDQGAQIEALASKVTVLETQGGQIAAAVQGDDVSRQTALMGLITMALNDLSISATRLLVGLMDREGHSKVEVREFIQGLVQAHSAGDKDVFFKVLHQRLVMSSDELENLKLLIESSAMASQDLSKIIREMSAVTNLAKRSADDDVIRVIFDDAALKSLSDLLEQHFLSDGTAKVRAKAAVATDEAAGDDGAELDTADGAGA